MKQEIIIKKYQESKAITVLMRSKKMNVAEAVLDFIVVLLTPLCGIVAEADLLSDMGTYYLVEKENQDILVRAEKNNVEEQDITGQCNGKKFVIGSNKFRRIKKIYG